MKKYKLIVAMIAIAGITMTSCDDDFLTLWPRGDDVAENIPASFNTVEQFLTSAYQILLFDCYAGGAWMPVNLYHDIRSDDIYKGGGSAGDQEACLFVSEYRVTPHNVRGGWWSIFYTGLKRVNNALYQMERFEKEGRPNLTIPLTDAQEVALKRMEAEALTLRAWYVHWLWKTYGNIPYFTNAWTEEPYLARQHDFDEMYGKLLEDLDAAINNPDFPMTTRTGALRGRVNKSMAMMTRARVVMYYNGIKGTQDRYPQVLADMEAIIAHESFALVTTVPGGTPVNVIPTGFVTTARPQRTTTNPIKWIFLRNGEWSSESIFEVNHRPWGTTWGNAWTGFGTYTPRFIGGRNLTGEPVALGYQSGWGFAPVQRAAIEIFEEGDRRAEASFVEFPAGTYERGQAFQQTGIFLRKYIAREGYNDRQGMGGDADLSFENNKRIFRISEAYLNAAELAFYAGGASAAQKFLDPVRDRAFGNADNRIVADLNNIKAERRREFFGEGQRFWDLVRWKSDENGRHINDVLTVTDLSIPISRTFDWDIHKFWPISQGEIDRTHGTQFPLQQNHGY